MLIVSSSAVARPGWKRDLDGVMRNKPMGLHVRADGKTLYSWAAEKKRVPASNQKLLLSMALLDRLNPNTRLTTSALGRRVRSGTLGGNLFVVGRGDPTFTSGGSFSRSLPFRPSYLGRLAKKIKASGVRRIQGRVVGAQTHFAHDWWAPGWKSTFPSTYVALPAALNLDGNIRKGRHISNPEFRVADKLTKRLRSIGVRVSGGPKAGGPPPDYARKLVAEVRSPRLASMMRFMNRQSSNYFAEVFGKLLSVQRSGPLGTIAKGALGIKAWAARYNVNLAAHDASGLSSSNRVSPRALTRLLGIAHNQSWGARLRSTLPTGGEGTLEDRLHGVRVRAKTGTLTGVSALSGWVRLKRAKTWAEFSILSRGMSKANAVKIEDRIVRLLRKRARP